MPTIDELRNKVAKQEAEDKSERLRLQEKVLCAEITFPPKMQRELGITGFTMKYDEAKDFIEEELKNRDGNTITFSIRYSMKTNKWIENLPEADI